MPYVQGGSVQKSSTLPDIKDVYHSPTVFANNVALGLWQTPGQSSAFTITISVTTATLSTSSVAQTEALQPVKQNPTFVAQNAVEPNYTGTAPTPLTTSTGTTSVSSSSIVTWLEARLDEANRGMWLRQNPPQPAAIVSTPGNANIAGIWTSLGITQAPFTTDQPAWCMGFVNFALQQCGYLWCPEASAGAINSNPSRWHATQISIQDAQPGDIAYWSYSHVNFVYTNNNGTLSFIGGNQSSKTQTNNNNPSGSTVSQAWPSGWTQANGSLVAIYRPSTS